jgi:hypothetical protein
MTLSSACWERATALADRVFINESKVVIECVHCVLYDSFFCLLRTSYGSRRPSFYQWIQSSDRMCTLCTLWLFLLLAENELRLSQTKFLSNKSKLLIECVRCVLYDSFYCRLRTSCGSRRLIFYQWIQTVDWNVYSVYSMTSYTAGWERAAALADWVFINESKLLIEMCTMCTLCTLWLLLLQAENELRLSQTEFDRQVGDQNLDLDRPTCISGYVR